MIDETHVTSTACTFPVAKNASAQHVEHHMTRNPNESQIRTLVKDWAKAVRAKDMEACGDVLTALGQADTAGPRRWIN